jgi:uncharacterized membrane protein
MNDIALFGHLLGALLFVAGIVLAGTAFEVARRRDRPAEIALLLGLTRIGVVLVGVGALLLLGFGLWLVHLEHVGYGAGWVDAAIALYVIALALGASGGRRPKQARRLATKLATEGSTSAELRALLDDRPSLAANYASAAIVLAHPAARCRELRVDAVGRADLAWWPAGVAARPRVLSGRGWRGPWPGWRPWSRAARG